MSVALDRYADNGAAVLEAPKSISGSADSYDRGKASRG